MKKIIKRLAIIVAPILVIWLVIGPFISFDLPAGQMSLFDIINAAWILAGLVAGFAIGAILILAVIGLLIALVTSTARWIFTGRWIWGE